MNTAQTGMNAPTAEVATEVTQRVYRVDELCNVLAAANQKLSNTCSRLFNAPQAVSDTRTQETNVDYPDGSLAKLDMQLDTLSYFIHENAELASVLRTV